MSLNYSPLHTVECMKTEAIQKCLKRLAMAFVEMTCVQDMASPKPRFRIEARLGDERIVSEWVNEVTAEAFEKVLPEVIALVKRIDN